MTSVSCPGCGYDEVRRFYEVRGVPTQSCVLLDDRQAALDHPVGDVVLGLCAACGLVVNTAFDPELVDYGADYEDSQAHSPRWVAWARELVEELSDRHGFRGGRALEVGCGKGDFLALLADVADVDGVGYDPAYRPGPLVPPIEDRLTFLRRNYEVGCGGHDADLLVCRHTLEHVPDPARFVRTLRQGAADAREPLLLVEVPGTERIVREHAFWDVYYEHCTYLTEVTLRDLLRREGFDQVRTWTAFGDQYVLAEAYPGERRAALPTAEERIAWTAEVEAFAAGTPERIATLRHELEAAAAHGPVLLWGAGSKAVGYLTTLAADGLVRAVVDVNPRKQDRFLGGSGLPVIGPDGVRDLHPGTIVVMNPVYRDEIERDLASRDVRARVVAL